MKKAPSLPKSWPAISRALRIILIYILIGSLWILFSDKLLSMLAPDHDLYESFQTYKGSFYVLATACLLYFLIRGSERTLENSHVQLRESEERYRLLVELMSDGLGILDAAGRLTFANTRLCELLMQPVESLLGHALADFVFPDDQPLLRSWLSGQTDSPLQCRLLTPHTRHTAILSSHSLGGSAGARVLVVTDISALAESQEALRVAAADWQATFDAIADGIALLDHEGTILRCNQALSAFVGRPAEQIAQQKCWEIFHHASAPLPDCPFSRARRSRQREVAIFSMDSRTIQLTLDPLLDDRGSLRGAVHVSTDITERVRLEMQLRQSQKMETLGRLAGGVAHDFNNLLTAITAYADFANQSLEPTDPVREEITQILQVSERAAALTQQLLAFSRQQAFNPQRTNLNDLLRNVNKLLHRLLPENVHLILALDSGLEMSFVDVGQIEQVLVNLIVNARDAMPEGGIIRVRTTNLTLDEPVWAQMGIETGEVVLLQVSDTGTGMSPETISHIFEPFFTTKEAGKGTGLGLATVYGIIHQSHGAIEVQSEPGQGSTFNIFLPRYAASSPGESAFGQAQDLPRGSETILLVEDEPAVRELTARTLRGLGYHVLEAGSAHDALALLQEHRQSIQLLLTDVVLPDQNGVLLARQALDQRAEIRLLFCSGYTDDAFHGREGALQGIRLLRKPFGVALLAQTVRQVLDEPG